MTISLRKCKKTTEQLKNDLDQNLELYKQLEFEKKLEAAFEKLNELAEEQKENLAEKQVKKQLMRKSLWKNRSRSGKTSMK